MKKIGVYILLGNFYYVGSTDDLDRRLLAHRNGSTKTTRRIGEWKLVQFIECENLLEARRLEIRIKKSKNAKRWVEQPRT